jgi:hypothetical protein
MKNKELSQITNAYEKRLKQLNKNFYRDNSAGLNLFAEHLKYIRDYLLVKTTVEKVEPDECTSNKVASLIIATAEFDAYKNTIEQDKKDFHWNNFCELVKLNMGEWLIPNDTI